MKIINVIGNQMSNRHIVIISFLSPFILCFIWLIALILNADNIADFMYEHHLIVFWLALPLSYMAMPINEACNEIASTYICNSVSFFVIGLGLAINVLLLKLLLSWLSTRLVTRA